MNRAEGGFTVPDQDPIAGYARMKAAGALPRDVCARAVQDGLPAIEAMRVLRSLSDLSLDAAKGILGEVRGPRPGSFATREQLEDWLRQELGYCGCDHYGDAIELLRDVLRSIRDWEDAVAREDRAGQVRSRVAMRECLGYADNPGLATRFLYWLDNRDILWHAGRASECGLAEKGKELLEALERFHFPADPTVAVDAN